ncbi:MAG: hypothetical protein AAGD25_41230 [Cyanobacteria bacterium P01_F01_bin.150]
MSYEIAQAILTAAFNIVSISGISYVAIAFIISAIRHWQQSAVDADMDSPNPQQVEQIQDDNAPIGRVQTAKPVINDMCQIVPFARSQPKQTIEDYSTWSVAELRLLLNRRGISWRNVHGKGKHMRKAEMLNVLAELDARKTLAA